MEQAGALLATFLQQFATALHARGKVLSLDIGTDTNPRCGCIGDRDATIVYTNASVSALGGCYAEWWLLGALNATAVDRFINMTPYLSFEKYIIGTASMLAGFGDKHSTVASSTTGIGFLTGFKYETADLQRRFAVIDALDVKEVCAPSHHFVASLSPRVLRRRSSTSGSSTRCMAACPRTGCRSCGRTSPAPSATRGGGKQLLWPPRRQQSRGPSSRSCIILYGQPLMKYTKPRLNDSTAYD
jgi:hypothetical protein